MRLINADALKEKLLECEFKTNCLSEECTKEVLKVLRIFIPQIIANEPTIHVRYMCTKANPINRLTDPRFAGDGFYEPKNKEDWLDCFVNIPSLLEIYTRLAEYESTGLSPEEIIAMQKLIVTLEKLNIIADPNAPKTMSDYALDAANASQENFLNFLERKQIENET